jgi:hypothetical protein
MESTKKRLKLAPAAARHARESVGAGKGVAKVEDAAPGAIAAIRNKKLATCEEEFARKFVLLRNASLAFQESHDCASMGRQTIYTKAYKMRNAPHISRRIDELLSAAAHATHIDIQKLLMQDFELVEAAQSAPELTSFVWHCCRHCYGIDHQYQWVSATEYAIALAKVLDENEERRSRKQRMIDEPKCDGGFGFDAQREPHTECPACVGLGTQRAIFADTTKLTGAAAILFKGVKQTASGIELITHDVDKARDRLFR